MKRLAAVLLSLAVYASPALADEAIFAAGCFWCTEADFEKLPGVRSAVSGYIGGKTPNPNYKQVSSGSSGHTEAVRVDFDPAVVSYTELLAHFWVNVDPTVDDRQFCDIGSQYRPGIFVLNETQREAATASRAAIVAAGKPSPIKVPIATAGKFWEAEDYHQDYYKKNPIRYNYYRHGCGRDARLKQLWGKAVGR